jgi:hypothetical protein
MQQCTNNEDLIAGGTRERSIVAFPIFIETNGIPVDISNVHDNLPSQFFPATLFCLSRFVRPPLY